MRELMRYAAALEGKRMGSLPPVDTWARDHVGDIDILISADGMWHHEGAPIKRAELVRLFSTILRRDGCDYYLVTPTEKLKISVEDAPFLAVAMDVVGDGTSRRLSFRTNLGDCVEAGPDHKLTYRLGPSGQSAPYIEVRGGLEARIARSIYYDLVALTERRHMDGNDVIGLWSYGVFFPFAGNADFEH